MRKLLPVLCLLPIFACHAGIVQTFTGETYEGDIRLDSMGIAVTPSGGAVTKIDSSNILDANFADKKKEEKEPAVRGVTLKNGSTISAGVNSLDAVAVKLGGQTVAVPAAEIARVVFKTIPPDIASKIEPGHYGALLENGDLFEGEVREMADGKAKVVSPIFGLHIFNVEKELLALLLRDVEKKDAQYEVQTKDGSLFLVDNLQIASDAISLQIPVVGAVRIPADQVAEICAGGARYQNLAVLQPLRVDAPQGTAAGAALNVNHTAANEPLTVSGETFPLGLETTVGTVVTYPVQPGFGTFIARVGVPATAPAPARFVFAVYADGRQVFKSQPLGPSDKPLPIRAIYGTARTLSLRVEPAAPGSTAGSGIWGNPRMLKR